MNKWQNKLYLFLYGRNGIDELYKFYFYLYLVIFILGIFVKSIIIFYLEVIFLVLMFHRLLSKNIEKRRKENKKYLKLKENIDKYFNLQKRKFSDRNTHIYKKCPKCKTTVRLPLKKGKHTVKCPNCSNRFEVKCRRNEKIKVEIIRKEKDH